MMNKNLILCFLAGLSFVAIKAGELGEKEITSTNPLEFLPEHSKIRGKCLRLSRSWIFKSTQERGCDSIVELFRKQMTPDLEAEEQFKNNLGEEWSNIMKVRRRNYGLYYLRNAIRDVLPKETDKAKFAEYDTVVATYDRIGEVFRNKAAAQRHIEKQAKIEAEKNPKF